MGCDNGDEGVATVVVRGPHGEGVATTAVREPRGEGAAAAVMMAVRVAASVEQRAASVEQRERKMVLFSHILRFV